MTTGNVFSGAVTAAVRAYFDFTKDDIFNQIDGNELLTQFEPDSPTAQFDGVAGPGYGTLTIEGQQYGSNELWKEYPRVITLRKYTSQLRWSEEDVHWLSKANKQAQEMKVSSISSSGVRPLVGNINRDVARMFYLGNGTTFFTGGNSEALISASHTIRKTAATQTNIVTSNPVLSTDAVQTAVNQMNRFKGMNDVQLQKVRRLRLVVPTDLEATAFQIKDSLYGPNNANLGLQRSSETFMAKRGIDFNVVTLPEIPSAYAAYWWLVDLDRAQDRFFLCWGWKPRMSQETIESSGEFAIDASAYFGPHALGWQWVIQSTGAGS